MVAAGPRSGAKRRWRAHANGQGSGLRLIGRCHTPAPMRDRCLLDSLGTGL
jgi:hypothetical protein